MHTEIAGSDAYREVTNQLAVVQIDLGHAPHAARDACMHAAIEVSTEFSFTAAACRDNHTVQHRTPSTRRGFATEACRDILVGETNSKHRAPHEIPWNPQTDVLLKFHGRRAPLGLVFVS